MNTLTQKREELAGTLTAIEVHSGAVEAGKQRAAILTREIAELECERWKPEEGDIYWYAGTHGAFCKTCWEGGNVFDGLRYNAFNVFRTREEAETQAKRDRVRRKADWAYGVAQKEPTLVGSKLCWYRADGEGYLAPSIGADQGVKYFSSQANTERFRELMGEDFEAWLKL